MTARWLQCAGVACAPACAVRALAVVLAGVLAAGCAGPQDSAAERGVVTRSTSRVAPGQTGLEVARWEVEDSDERLEKALRALQPRPQQPWTKWRSARTDFCSGQ